jgi:hypothetical protein
MKNTILKYVGLSLAVFIPFGCSPESTGSDQGSGNDYVLEKQKIKTSVNSQNMLEEKIQALQKKYGIDPTAKLDPAAGNQPAVIKSGACTNCSTPKPFTPLGKKATTDVEIFGVKSAQVSIERPYFEAFWVNQGESITVSANATSSGVDPFMVLYDFAEGGIYDYTSQQKLNVMGWNDDYNGLSPQVSVGPSPTSKLFVVLVFAYDAYSKGQANVTVTIGSSTYTRNNVYVKGTALFYDNSNFVDKSGYVVDAYGAGWTRYLPGTTAFAAADYGYWDSEYNWGNFRPECSGDSYIWAFNMSESKGVANDDSPGGSCSGVMNDATWSYYPDSYHYPSFVLLGGYSDGGLMKFLQLSGFAQ